jgi:hypothetical protein
MQVPLNMPASPFAVLTLIVAPAILANASSVLAMSTSNRLARAADRVRDLSQQLRAREVKDHEGEREHLVQQYGRMDRRASLLIQSLKMFYAAIGFFSLAALASVVGALVSSYSHAAMVALSTAALVAGTIAIAALSFGSVVLVWETRLALTTMRDEFRFRLGQTGPD